MKKYLSKNGVLLLIHIIFICLLFVVNTDFVLYINFLFYLLIVIYFYFKRDKKKISYSKLILNIKSGRKFWIQVLLTIIILAFSFVIMTLIGNMFPNLEKGNVHLNRDGLFEIFIFAVSTIILPPIAEELFYRYNIISFDSKLWLITTIVFSSFLYGTEHSITLWGAFLWSIVGVGFAVSYVLTKNIYVTMTAHFITNIIGNGSTIIILLIKYFS